MKIQWISFQINEQFTEEKSPAKCSISEMYQFTEEKIGWLHFNS